MAKGKKLYNRVADRVVIERHKAGGLKIRGAGTEFFDVESIVFRGIEKAPWFVSQDQTEDHIVGKVEFHSDDRCFYNRPTGLPSRSQVVIEEGNKSSGKRYNVPVSSHELCAIYDAGIRL